MQVKDIHVYLVKMESDILNVLKFEMGGPTSKTLLRLISSFQIHGAFTPTCSRGAVAASSSSCCSILELHRPICLQGFISAPSSIVHQAPEGHVGVYWRGGSLMKIIAPPGYHLKLALITQFEPIQVTLQTDQVKGILGMGIHTARLWILESLASCRKCGALLGMRILTANNDLWVAKAFFYCLTRP